jgi:hypothetical protein
MVQRQALVPFLVTNAPTRLKLSRPIKKRRLSAIELAVQRLEKASDSEEENEDENQQPTDILEFNTYLELKLSSQEKDKFKEDPAYILTWWRVNAAKFPKLAKVAQVILAIPASSSADESVFSDTGNNISAKRTRLLPSNVDKLLVIRSNKDLCS